MDADKQRRIILIISIAFIVLLAATLSIHHDVDVEIEGKGTVEPSHASVHLFGTAEFKLVPAEGYKISEVLVDGEPKEVKDGVLRLTHVVSDHKVHVTFSPIERYELKITSNEYGTVSPVAGMYAEGEKVVVDMEPRENYVIGDVTVDGKSVGSTNRIEMTMDSDHSVNAVFRLSNDEDPLVDVSVDVKVGLVTGAFYGTISPSGPVRVAYGGTLNITISLNEGYVLGSVVVDGQVMGDTNIVTVNDVTKDISISITVLSKSVRTYTITSSSTDGGTISPSGAYVVAEGDSTTFVMTANDGYHLSSLTVDGVSVSTPGRYTFTDVRSDHTIAAVFVADTPTPPRPKILESITLTDCPTTCIVNQALDTSGMKVTAHWNDGTTSIVSGYTISPDTFSTVGSHTVTVSYLGKTATFQVTVSKTFITEVISVGGVSGGGKSISQLSPMTMSGMAPGDIKSIVVDMTANTECNPYLMLYGLVDTDNVAQYVTLTVGTETVRLSDLPTGELDPSKCISLGTLASGEKVRITIEVSFSTDMPASLMGKSVGFTLGIGVWQEI